MPRILNLAFYRFTPLRDLESLRERVKVRALADGLHGSILLAEEGINAFLAGEESVLRPYLAWLIGEIPGLAGIAPKESFSNDIPFTRMLVKIKKEIITMGRPEIRPSVQTGNSLAPTELKRWYDEKRDFVIVDTRNDYEISSGAFRNAIHYDIGTFREFPEKLEQAADALRDKTVVMYCTGGIRCEKATALAQELGIRDVHQLEGGILKYFEDVGSAHYRGDCFVFDHRATVDAELEPLPERVLREKAAVLSLRVVAGDPESERVILALQAKGLSFLRTAEASDSARGLPSLESGDHVLASGNAILDLLDEHFPETRALRPKNSERLERMRLWVEWVDQIFAREAERWIRDRSSLSAEESYALEVRLEKLLYRLKTPLQRNRRFLVINDVTHADLAAATVLTHLRAAEFPRDYPERFDLVWDWHGRTLAVAQAGLTPTPKVLCRSESAVWPN